LSAQYKRALGRLWVFPRLEPHLLRLLLPARRNLRKQQPLKDSPQLRALLLSRQLNPVSSLK
jgi:hypothetical protein